MATKSKPVEKGNAWVSSALKVNLERTATDVRIPERYAPLLQIVRDHYGLQKKPARC